MLEGKGYQHYLPLYSTRRRWSDRVIEARWPLFPGYVFCRFDPKNRLPIITTPNIVSILGFGKEPAPIPDSEIEAVKAVLRSRFDAKPCPFLHVGQRVRVKRGSLEGLEGILTKKKTEWRMVLSITMLQRSISVEIDVEWIEAV